MKRERDDFIELFCFLPTGSWTSSQKERERERVTRDQHRKEQHPNKFHERAFERETEREKEALLFFTTFDWSL
jgi:hypothetical protein